MLKEGDVISEQIFVVSFQVTDSAPSGIQSAAIDQDYRFGIAGQTSLSEFFLPFQQRIPLQFELLADTFPEETEAFQVTVSSEDFQDLGGGLVEHFPTYQYPLNLTSEIIITILDNDRKLYVANFFAIFYLISCLAIIIGFTNTSYTVDEGFGTLRVDVQVLNVPDEQPLPAPVVLTIQSVSGSASKCTEPVYFVCLKVLMLYIR